jgi:hypothetical protein
MTRRTATAAVVIWLVSAAGIIGAAVVTAASGAGGFAESILGFSFPARESWRDLLAVLWRNGGLAAAALLLAGRAVRDSAFAAMICTAWAFYVGLAGAALPAFGERLVRHAAVYGTLELAGFSVILATCLRIRRLRGRVQGGELLVAGTLLGMAAVTETVWPWRL